MSTRPNPKPIHLFTRACATFCSFMAASGVVTILILAGKQTAADAAGYTDDVPPYAALALFVGIPTLAFAVTAFYLFKSADRH